MENSNQPQKKAWQPLALTLISSGRINSGTHHTFHELSVNGTKYYLVPSSHGPKFSVAKVAYVRYDHS